MVASRTQPLSAAAILFLLLGILSTANVPGARAQVFNLQKQREPVTSLTGKWRFHPGDSPDLLGKTAGTARGVPLWAQPGFDDSKWALLRSDQGWNQQGYPTLSGVAWYRFQVIVGPGVSSFLIALPYIESTYELYANGRAIAQVGNMPPDARRIVGGRRLFTVPAQAMPQPHPVWLALRVWRQSHLRVAAAGGPHGAPYAGHSPAINVWFENHKRDDLFQLGGQYTVYVIEVLAGLASLLLYLLRRTERMYLWFGIMCLLPANFLPWLVLAHMGVPLVWGAALMAVLRFLEFITAALFYLAFVKMRPRPSIYIIFPASLLILFGYFLYVGVRPVAAFAACDWAGVSIYSVSVVMLMAQAWRAEKPDARLLFWPVTLFIALVWLSSTDWLLHALEKDVVAAFDFSALTLFSSPFPVTLDDLTNLIWYLGISGVLICRFARISKEEERLSASLTAARHVQQRLVPAELPRLSGFHTEAAYLSAEEVGGDFYQVIAQGDAGLLVVIGDVSGKGLQAAMLGTVAVGAIRSLAQEELEPAMLLTRLNQQLVPTTEDSFITCLCVHISREGVLTVANAGHLPPYVDGEELACPSDLPLGVLPDFPYEQCRSVLLPDQRVTFMSDGVIEARGKDGELFGFERARRTSRMSAQEIAESAQRFGQQDDITVLTLDWTGAVASVV